MDWASAWMARGSNLGGDKRFFFSSPKRPNQLWDPHSLLFNGYRGSSPGAKQPGSQFNHSPAFSVEVKSGWSYTTTPLYAYVPRTVTTVLIFFFNYEGY